jgi:hypothetical protein
MDIEIGYYIVKFYNHDRKKILYWNGESWEGFKSDPMIHDEIESYTILKLEEI